MKQIFSSRVNVDSRLSEGKAPQKKHHLAISKFDYTVQLVEPAGTAGDAQGVYISEKSLTLI